MTRLDRSKAITRRKSAPVFDCLEGRQLLNATPTPHHAAPTVHADVTHSKAHAAPKVTHASKSTIHAEVTHSKAIATSKSTTHATLAAHATKVTTHASKSTTHVAAKPVLRQIKVHNKFLDISVEGNGPTGSQDGSQASYSPVPGAYNPTQLKTAYGVNLLGLANQGQGVTIGIVDELNDTSIISDANVYSSTYNLPQFNTGSGPTLTVQLDSTFASVGSAAGSGVGEETSLDVEMVHAMAPMANIVLVEVPAPSGNSVAANTLAFQELLEGVQEAASVPGVVAVSLSYGYPEASLKGGTPSISALDSTYLSTGAAAGVAVTISTGDGSTPLFPASTPDAIGVGGTSLYLSSARGKYGYETAWGGLAGAGAGGGGASSTFAAPTFQSAHGVNLSAFRTIPDVSLNADPVTAASVYDSLDASSNGGDPWFGIGGTSEAAPLFAGVLALTQQDRIAVGMPILSSVQVDTAVYEAYNSPSYLTYFNDITLGNNSNVNTRGRTTVTGYSATAGYDLATGVGSPIANSLVPYLTKYVIGT